MPLGLTTIALSAVSNQSAAVSNQSAVVPSLHGSNFVHNFHVSGIVHVDDVQRNLVAQRTVSEILVAINIGDKRMWW